MTLQVVDFSPAHLGALLQAKGQSLPPPAVVRALTVFDGEQPLCCFGISSPWSGLGIAWCEEREPLLQHGRRVGLVIARAWRQWLAEHHYARIESRVPVDHADARRLLLWLGFVFVAAKPWYGPDGKDVWEYVYYP